MSALEIGFSVFRFRIRTVLSGMIAESAPLSLNGAVKDLWIVAPAADVTLRRGDTLQLKWRSIGIDADEPLILSLRGSASEPWQGITTIRAGSASHMLHTAQITIASFQLQLATADRTAVDVSGVIDLIPASATNRILVLRPLDRDTLWLHRDYFRWKPAPGMDISGISGIQIDYAHGAAVNRGGTFPTDRREIPLMEIIPEGQSSSNFTFYVRALPDTHAILIDRVVVSDFRFLTRLEGAVLHRGDYPKVYTAASRFSDKIPYKDSGRINFPRYYLSTDLGQTWKEENVFSSNHHQKLLLSHPAADGCYLRMEGFIGRRMFADTTGPFRIEDRTSALWEWNVGDVMRYRYRPPGYPYDTLVVECTDIEDRGSVILYTLREYSEKNDTTAVYTVTEFPDDMHRLVGWHLLPVDTYRYCDVDLDEYDVSWSRDADITVHCSVKRQKGIKRLYRWDIIPVPPHNLERVWDLIE
ncbi:MAG: hypothetical protein WC824_02345 [Bacteroidota bacterium]